MRYVLISVADPGFDLRGGRALFQREGRGRKSSESVVGLNKSHFSVFLAIFLLKLWFKLIASEASEEKNEKNSVLGIKKS